MAHNFEELLRMHLKSKDKSEIRLAIFLKVSPGEAIGWAKGTGIPTWEQLQYISDYLELSEVDQQELLAAHMVARRRFPIQETLPGVITSRNSPDSELSQSITSLQIQISTLEKTLEQLSGRVYADNSGTESGPMQESLASGLEELREQVNGLQQTGERITAQVEIPTREAMKVKLVPATFIARIEEYSSDSVIWYAVAGAFGGATLGIVVNAATGGTMTPTAWVLITIFVLLMSLFIVLIRRNAERLREAKWQMLGVGIDPALRREADPDSNGLWWTWPQRNLGRATNQDRDNAVENVKYVEARSDTLEESPK